ncbi:toll/interleukin-1 receptor domain-containing protein [Methylopila sp. M107]|uniref:toll/interleukin-1 receptor domain-containing protein n=1 Tax=Methylopila sp. M107 TaxID=1101190 RepID=UPI0003AB37F2|nr:toll/interleukin-1 receptor domain-containing protein [Methylopila sp. M107]
MALIFISHASANNPAAIAIRDWLIAEGWNDLFLDVDPVRGIVAAERWERALNEQASRCEAVIFLISRDWLGSEWCQREYHLADKLNKRMFGLLIEDISPNDLPKHLTADWQIVNLASGRDHIMFRSTSPDGSTERHVTFSESGLKRLKAGLAKAGLDPRFFDWPPAYDPDRAPYRGLKALEADDAGIFFGREAATIAVLDRLRGMREQSGEVKLLVLLGGSGAGKSSFMRAGVLPRLKRDDRNFMPLPVVRPARAVMSGPSGLLSAFEDALRHAGRPASLARVAERLHTGAEGALALAEELAAAATSGDQPGEPPRQRPTVVIAIDQAEELFQLDGAGESAMFLAMMRDLAATRGANILFLVAIRTDSYPVMQISDELRDLPHDTYSLQPLPRGAYGAVIEGPARRLKDGPRRLRVEPALTSALLTDVEADAAKDALPLLSFTLERLYLAHRGDGELTAAGYRSIGGIGGSIEAAVAKAMRNAEADRRVPSDPAERDALLRQGLIPWLAMLDPETKEPRRRVARMTEIPEASRPLIEHLIAARLLTSDVEPDSDVVTVEPTHEAILRQWSLLAGWLSDDLIPWAAVEALQRARRDWDANGRKEDWISHEAGRLEDAERVSQSVDFRAYLTAADRDYIAAARERENRRRDQELAGVRALAQATERELKRTKQLVAVAVAAAAAAGAFGYWGVSQARNSEQSYATALEAGSTTADLVRNQLGLSSNVDYLDDAQLGDGIRIGVGEKLIDTWRIALEKLPKIDDARNIKAQIELFRLLMKSYSQIGRKTLSIQSANKVLELSSNRSAAGAVEPNTLAKYRLESHLLLGIYGNIDGDYATAEKEFNATAAIADAEEPKHAEKSEARLYWQRAKAAALEGLGDRDMRLKRFSEAATEFEAVLSLFDRLLADAPDDKRFLRKKAINVGKLVDTIFASGDTKRAEAKAGENIRISAALVAADGNNADLIRGLGIAYEKRGLYRRHLGAGDPSMLAGARSDYLAARELMERLAARDGGNFNWRLNLGYTLLGYADLLRELSGGDAAALAAYHQFLDTMKPLAAESPENRIVQRNLTTAYQRLARLYGDTGDQERARAYLIKCAGRDDIQNAYNPRNSDIEDPAEWCRARLAQKRAATPG